METVKSEEYRGYTINICPDEYPQDPRDWDNLGIIAYKHSNYKLGEEEISDPVDWLAGMLGFEDTYYFAEKHGQEQPYCDDIKSILEEMFLTKYVAAPLYIYEHGGIRIKIGDFHNCGLSQGHARFDSGQFGYIYTTLEQLNKLGHDWKRWSAKRRKQAMEWLSNEVETLDQYVSGDVYGFEILNPEGESVDSCWGYFGYENIDELIDECKSTVDYEIKDVMKKRFTKIKEYINNKVPFIYRELPELV